MKRKLFGAMVILAVLILTGIAAQAQTGDDIYWRLDPRVKSCSMVINPALTQGQWHRFVNQVGAIASFKSLGPAKTLGKMKFSFAIDEGRTPVNQRDNAWINTFVHPDEDCPLGDVIVTPTLRAAFGVADNMEAGAYWTSAPNANYGMVGAEFKYAFLQETMTRPAVAARTSFIALTGVPDFNLNIYSLELLASKKVSVVTPYLGIRQNVAVGTETTSKVNLDQEIIPITQGYFGMAYYIWKVSLTAEYNVSTVNTFAFAAGFNL